MKHFVIFFLLFYSFTSFSQEKTNYNKNVYPLIKEGKYTEALPLLEKFLQEKPEHINANYWCAKILEIEGKKTSNPEQIQKAKEHYAFCFNNATELEMTMATAGRYPDVSGIESTERLNNFKVFLRAKYQECESLERKFTTEIESKKSTTNSSSPNNSNSEVNETTNSTSKSKRYLSYREQGVKAENRFDENEKKHGYWDPGNNAPIMLFYHGEKIGLIETERGYQIKDTLGNVIELFEEFENKPFYTVDSMKDGFSTRTVWYREKGQDFIWELDSRKLLKSDFKFGGDEPYKSFFVKHGTQIKTHENAYRGENGIVIHVFQREISEYENNVLKSVKFYYPSTNKVYCDVTCKSVMSSISLDGRGDFPGQSVFGVADSITYYHENGKVMMAFNAEITNKWRLDNAVLSRGKGYLEIPLSEIFPKIVDFPNKIIVAGQLVPDEMNFWGQDIPYGDIANNRQMNLGDNYSIKIYDENGIEKHNLIFVKTQLEQSGWSTKKSYNGDYHYGLDGNYKFSKNETRYYKGVKDSVWIYVENDFRLHKLMFDKGVLKFEEVYFVRGNYKGCVSQRIYNDKGELHGSQKDYNTSSSELTEVIYENGKKISAPPVRKEEIITLFQ